MSRIVFNFIIGIYNSVNKAYDLFSNIAYNKDTVSDEVMSNFGDLIDAVYVLCGVFMLFRVTVSFINMLIDPDKVNDKQIGAGSILKRIFITVLLLIVCRPSNFCFGLLDTLEEYLLAPNGLLQNIMPSSATSSQILSKGYSIMFDDVYATNNVNCLYTAYKLETVTVSGTGTNTGSEVNNTIIQSKPVGQIYVTFTKEDTGNNLKYKLGKNSTWYLSYGSKGDVGNTTYNNSYLNSIKTFKFNTTKNNTSYLDSGTCPKGIEISGKTLTFHQENVTSVYNFYGNNVSIDISSNDLANEKTQELSSTNTKFKGVTGYSDYYSNKSNVYALYDEDDSMTASQIDAAVAANMESYLSSGGDSSFNFGRSVLLSLTDVLEESEETTNTLNSWLSDQNSNNEVYKLAKGDNPTIEIDAILAIVVGLGLIVYLFIMSIDVIVRNFKFIILKIIAPIPVICYIDPKDKVFNAWLKMLVSVYIDLFIKLLCINLSIRMLKLFYETNQNVTGFYRIIFIMGIFVFAKALPSLISKIFGIEASASSFKEIGKVAKTGLGIAAGGAIAAGAGLGSAGLAIGAAAKSGKGAGNIALAAAAGIGNAFRGTLRGMGGGARGNITAGFSMAQRNMSNRNAYRNGIGAGALIGSSMLGGIGMDYASKVDREVAKDKEEVKALSDFAGVKDQMDNAWTSSKYYSSLAGLKNGNGNPLLDAYEMSTARDLWIKSQLGQNDPNSYSDKENNLMRKLDDTGNVNYCTIEDEKGKQEALRTALRTANQMRDGSKTIRDAVGNDNFTSYAQIDEATTKARDAKVIKETEIGAKTVANERYNQSAAAREANKNNGGNK